MKRALQGYLLMSLLLGGFQPVFAEHGSLSSAKREAWVHEKLQVLADAGFLPKRKWEALTNLEVVEHVAYAAGLQLSQLADPLLPPPPPEASGALQSLVQEFRKELEALAVDVDEVEKRLPEQKAGLKKLSEKQAAGYRKTGTEVGGRVRSWFDTLRGFGRDSTLAPLDRLGVTFVDMHFRSIPVPNLLFTAKVRAFSPFGFFFANNISPNVDLHWFQLSGYAEGGTVKAGDFYAKYSPLVLWNNDNVYSLLEPEVLRRRRLDAEEIADLAVEEPVWRLRGVNFSSWAAWPGNPILSHVGAEIMGGRLKAETATRFASYFAGGRGEIGFYENKIGAVAQGLLLWDDLQSASITYIPGFPLTWAQRYEVGSAGPRIYFPFTENVALYGEGELANAKYTDDQNDPDRVFQDWAVQGKGGLKIGRLDFYGRYWDIGPYFYSPGAQTLRRTPAPASSAGYLTTSENKDFLLNGLRNRFVFQDVERFNLAPYFPWEEMIFPYGDATPNRKGFGAGIAGSAGKKGWLKPRGYFISVEEHQPEWVVNASGTDIVAVDTVVNTTTARSFAGYEAVLELDLAALSGSKRAFRVGAGFKHQDVSRGDGVNLEVDTLTGVLTVSPDVFFFRDWTFDLFARQSDVQGSEFLLSDGTRRYPFFANPVDRGKYSFVDASQKRLEWGVGAIYPVAKNVSLRGDFLLTEVTLPGDPNYDERIQRWRINYEASF